MTSELFTSKTRAMYMFGRDRNSASMFRRREREGESTLSDHCTTTLAVAMALCSSDQPAKHSKVGYTGLSICRCSRPLSISLSLPFPRSLLCGNQHTHQHLPHANCGELVCPLSASMLLFRTSNDLSKASLFNAPSFYIKMTSNFIFVYFFLCRPLSSQNQCI